MRTIPEGQVRTGAQAEPRPQARAERKREALFRALLILGSIAFAWVAIEIPALFNLVDYEGLEFSQAWGSVRFIRVPDPQLLHIEPPYAHYAGSSRGGDFETRFQVAPAEQTLYRWDLKYDRNGFRNATDLSHADIAVIGDSMVEGMTVSDAELTTSVLAGMEGRVVANLGQYGYGPQQELAVFDRFALPLRPRVVVWMFFEGNDLTDEIAYRKIAANPPGAWSFFLQRSFTRFAVRAVRGLLAGAKPPGVIQSGEFAGRNIYFSIPAAKLSPEESEAVEAVARMAGSARDRAAAQGARLVFVFIPDKFRVLRGYCRFPGKSECRNWVLSDLPTRMRSALQAVSPDIGYVDLTPDLENLAKSGVLPYYSDDVHLAPEGHRAAATAIHEFLKTQSETVSTRVNNSTERTAAGTGLP
jgi:hypothetical protein